MWLGVGLAEGVWEIAGGTKGRKGRCWGRGRLTQVRPSARACVAEASSIEKSRKDRDLEKEAVWWAVG